MFKAEKNPDNEMSKDQKDGLEDIQYSPPHLINQELGLADLAEVRSPDSLNLDFTFCFCF